MGFSFRVDERVDYSDESTDCTGRSRIAVTKKEHRYSVYKAYTADPEGGNRPPL